MRILDVTYSHSWTRKAHACACWGCNRSIHTRTLAFTHTKRKIVIIWLESSDLVQEDETSQLLLAGQWWPQTLTPLHRRCSFLKGLYLNFWSPRPFLLLERIRIDKGDVFKGATISQSKSCRFVRCSIFQMLVISRFVQDWGHDCYANNWLVWKMSQGLRTQYLVLVECGNQITQNDQRKIKL